MALLAAGLAWSLGFLLVRWLWPVELRQHTLALRCLLAAGFGAGLASLVTFANLVGAGELRTGWLVASELALAVVLLAANALRRAPPAPLPERPANPQPLALPPWMPVLALLVLGGALFSFVVATLADPHGVADALGIWNLRANLVFGSGDGWRRAFTEASCIRHVDYPPLLPLLLVTLWQFGGASSPVVSAAVAGVFTFAAAGVLAAVLRVVRGGPGALAAGATLLAFPAFVDCGATQFADVPLAFFFLATVALLVVHDECVPISPRLLVLAGASMALAACTKNEGLLFFGVVVAVRLCCAWRRGTSVRAEGAALALGAAPVLVALAMFKSGIESHNDLLEQVASGGIGKRLFAFDRWLEIVGAMAELAWSLGAPALGATIAWCVVCRESRLRLPLGIAAAMLAGYFATYLGTSVNLTWHLSTSCQRLLLQLLPLVLLGVFAGSTRRGAAC